MSKADLKKVAKIERLIVEAMQRLRELDKCHFAKAYLKEALEEVRAARSELEYEHGPAKVFRA